MAYAGYNVGQVSRPFNGGFDGEHAVVSGRIQIGEPIIAVGGHFLHEKQRVQVAEARVARE